MEITVETATIQMLNVLYEIEKQSFKEEAFSKQQISYLLIDNNGISLAAKVGGEVAGFIIGRIDFVRNRPVGHVMTIDVSPIYRRQGIGQRLMVELEAIFKQKGATECLLEVRENNVAALALYQKLGYQKVGLLENYYGRAHGLYLRKTLP
jgi:ribosomal-protein-alanine N-acetyltransferase